MKLLLKKPKRANGIFWKTDEKKKSVYVFDSSKNTAYCFNETALSIWNLCDGKRNVGAIISSVADEHGIPEKLAIKDVAKFIVDAGRLGLLVL